MRLIDRIESRPVFARLGAGGGNAAIFSLLRGADALPATPRASSSAGNAVDTGLTGWAGIDVGSANDAMCPAAAPAGAVA